MQRLRFVRTWILTVVIGFFAFGCGGRAGPFGDDQDAAATGPTSPDAAGDAVPAIRSDAGSDASFVGNDAGRSDARASDAGANDAARNDAARNDAGSDATRDVSAPDRLISIAIDPPSAMVRRNTTLRIRVIATYVSSSAVDVTERASLSVDQPGVVRVDGPGLITGLRANSSAVLFANFEGQTATARITVVAGAVVSIIVTPDMVVSEAGNVVEFRAAAQMEDGSYQTVTQSVRWASSDEKIAHMLTNGQVFPIGRGTALITATSGNVTGSATLVVPNDPLRGLEISPRFDVLELGASAPLHAWVVDSLGKRILVDSFVEWSSSQPGVARVENDRLMAVSPGMSVISAKLGPLAAAMTITVSAATLEAITVEPRAVHIEFPGKTQLTATGRYSDGSNRDITYLADWYAKEDSVDRVSVLGDGLVEAINLGTATVAASFHDLEGSATVTVGPGSPTELRLENETLELPRYAASRLAALLTYADGSTLYLGDQATWSTDDASIATIAPGGPYVTVSADGIGRTRVRASILGMSASMEVVVLPVLLGSIEISPQFESVFLSETLPMGALARFADGSTYDVESVADWSVADPSILSVSNVPGERGLLRPLRVGSTRVSATRGGVQGSTIVTIIE